MKLAYECNKKRLVVGGLDNQIKFLGIEDENISVCYKLKVPSEVFALGMSADGNHYAIGLNDGSLIIKSRKIEEEDDKRDEEQKLID
mmetsp:Transcript_1468/g.985  ORF Transcript_1468/g.985 Transcript_1468/m.985 type:complete len:87 (+) Transcript_1468:41-301(+)|eukprot:CAMPEP_0202979602 /NCGR_PEP_ID=MMETSP1396-20130829/85703_1 /ASSEMBLY_ACC=CAM_ASM_000872 /TAXON_ID= /ORGANISM="Pseudokeronopsis sp., Strain Brazil" /LENGTH=86 /DNA_ID=CAMNT_0049719095 /DNA_START=723 /DNA_END=983 /DNA_ORIENTATION=+